MPPFVRQTSSLTATRCNECPLAVPTPSHGCSPTRNGQFARFTSCGGDSLLLL